jgi:hypothetical protein
MMTESTGFVNAGYRVNIAYRILSECTEILNTRVKWVSKSARDNFESLTMVGTGAFEMMISFFPCKSFTVPHSLLSCKKRTLSTTALSLSLSPQPN